MLRYSFVRFAGFALIVYGLIGFAVGSVLLVVGYSTFTQISNFGRTIGQQPVSIAKAVGTATRTIGDAADSATDFEHSIEGARTSADSASKLAFDASISFRTLAQNAQLQIFGVQPLTGLAPQFTNTADQLVQLAIELGDTRDSLRKNATNAQRVSGDLRMLQQELDSLSTALESSAAFDTADQRLPPFEVAVYGMCALVLLQSLFSLVAGIAVLRLLESLSDDLHQRMFGNRRRCS